MTAISFNVNGIPGAQGSKRHVGHGVMIESSKKVKPWRTDVKTAAEAATAEWERWIHGGGPWSPIDGPARVEINFRFTRPRSHYGTGRNASVLKPTAPAYCVSRSHGDVDKLERSTFDALVAAGVLADDSLVVIAHALKRYCDPGETPGAHITVSALFEAAAA